MRTKAEALQRIKDLTEEINKDIEDRRTDLISDPPEYKILLIWIKALNWMLNKD